MENVQGAISTVKNKTEEVKETVGNFIGNTSEAVSGAIDTVKQNGGDLLDQGGDLANDVFTTDKGQAVLLLSFGLTLLFCALILCMCYMFGCAAFIMIFCKKGKTLPDSPPPKREGTYRLQTKKSSNPVKGVARNSAPKKNTGVTEETPQSKLLAPDANNAAVANMEEKISEVRNDPTGSYTPPVPVNTDSAHGNETGVDGVLQEQANGAATSGDGVEKTESESPVAEGGKTDESRAGKEVDLDEASGDETPNLEEPKLAPATSALEEELDAYYTRQYETGDSEQASPKPQEIRVPQQPSRGTRLAGDAESVSVSSVFTDGIDDDLVPFSSF